MVALNAAIACFLFLALVYLMIQWQNPGLTTGQVSFRKFAPGVLLIILMMAAVTWRVVTVSSRYHARMTRLTAPPGRVNEVALAHYQSALDSVCLRIGRTAPLVSAANFPTANSFTFKKGGKYHVAVSPELLDSGLGVSQAEAIMAHEIAHVETDSVARLSMALGPVLCFISIAAFIALAAIALITRQALFVWLLAAPAGLCFGMMIFERMCMPSLSGRRPAPASGGTTLLDTMAGRSDSHTLSDTMADSIAASMISDPLALASAIETLSSRMSDAEAMPDELVADYLFIAPTKPWVPELLGPNSDYDPGVFEEVVGEGRGRRASSNLLAPFTRAGRKREVAVGLEQNMVLYVESRKQAVAKRIANLQEIERGNWQEFTEVNEGRIRLQPRAWE